MKYLSFLGWDPAYKSLAWSHVKINVDILHDLDEVCASDPTPAGVRRLSELLRGWCVVNSWGVVDLLPEKNLKESAEIERAARLKQFVQERAAVLEPETNVVVEHQALKMSFGAHSAVNNYSSIASHQIAYQFVTDFPTEFIDPKLKNNIVLGDIKLRGKKYADRKAHTRQMFDAIVRANRLHTDVARAYMDDLADSFMSVIAYCLKYALFRDVDRMAIIVERIVQYLRRVDAADQRTIVSRLPMSFMPTIA